MSTKPQQAFVGQYRIILSAAPAAAALRIMRYCLRYNTIPQIQKACAFSTFVGREITCFILFYCFRYLSGNFQRALNAVDQVAEQPNDHAALAP